jgi:hypothetical protein
MVKHGQTYVATLLQAGERSLEKWAKQTKGLEVASSWQQALVSPIIAYWQMWRAIAGAVVYVSVLTIAMAWVLLH